MSENTPNFEGEEMKMPTEQPASLARNESAVSLPIIIALVVALVVVAGGLYYAWTLSQNVAPPPVDQTRPTLETNREPETPTATAQIESMSALSTSDELVAIEADLEATPLDNLDAELLKIEAELTAEF